MSANNALPLIEKAQSRMLFKHLFFASVVLGTPMVETTKFPRAATNMRVIYYNKDFIESLKLPVVMFVIAHEVLHIILKHGLRRGGRDPDIWNQACDYVINHHLKEAGFTLWDQCLYNPQYAGMYEEQVYILLAQEQEPDAGGGQPGGGQPGGDGGPDGDEGEPDDGDDGDGSTISSGKPGGQTKRDFLHGDLTDFETPTDAAERAKLSNEIDRRVAQAVNMARQAGQMPAGLDLLMEGVLNPPQPWYALFHDFMTRFCQDEESWSKRNRVIHAFVLPSRRNPGMGGVGVIGDTSGSMLSYRVFPQVAEEINDMRLTAKPEFIQVIWADDTEAAHEERFEAHDEVVLHPRGGGGTDMRKPLKRMEDHNVDICVLVTDCETPWPSEPTPFPLIVLSTTDHEVPPWATKIRIR